MENTSSALKKTARFAGLLYLILTISGIYGLMIVPSQIIVKGDAVATSNNILASEFLFRTGIVNDIFSNTIFLILAMVLYRLFEQVSKNQSRLMLAMVMVQIPTVFIMAAFNFASLMILKGELLETFQLSQRQEVVMLLLKINDYATVALETYWGLWLLPFGLLVHKSGFIPRIFGILLIIAGVAYVVESTTFLLFPDYGAFVNQPVLVSVAVGEISIMLWLLIKGVKSGEG